MKRSDSEVPRQQSSERQTTILVAHPGAELYGSDRMTLESVRAFRARGWNVVATLPFEGPLADEISATGASVSIIGAPVLRKSALRPLGFLNLLFAASRSLVPALRLIRTVRPDAVYVATVTLPFWVVVAKLQGRPVIVHLHEAEVGARSVLRKAMTMPMLLADSVVANSQFTLRSLQADQPRLRGHTEVVPNALAEPNSPKSPRESIDDRLRLLYLGRISPRKGPQVAIAALAELCRSGLDAELELLGGVFDGYEWFDEELRQMVTDENISDRVRFLGFNEDVWPAIAGSDIVLVPSIAPEGFGNTAVEAVMARRPVVTSDKAGLAEAVGRYDSAVLVEPNSPEQLSRAVQVISENWPEFRSKASASAALAIEQHSPHKYAERITSVVRLTIEHSQ